MNRLWQIKVLLITGLVFTLASKGGCMDEVELDDGEPSDSDTGTSQGTDAQPETESQGAALKIISGVDILMVVDNSSSMAEEQEILSTEIYALLTKLIKPLQGAVYKALPEIRLAIASTDMGLHTYDGISSIPADLAIATCTGENRNKAGDNGAFLGKRPEVTTMELDGSRIACDADGSQCPAGWSCQDGFCAGPGGNGTVNCSTSAGSSWIEHSAAAPNPDLAVQAACMAMQGTTGCGIEQQLKSSVHALQNHPDFLDENHALLVLVVSDEEDCSIESGELLQTEQFYDQSQLNTACNLPESNEDYLVDALTLKEQLIALKGGAEENVYFAAIVGVPIQEDSPCIGFGDQLSAKGCLDDPRMQLKAMIFEDSNGAEYTHSTPACERHDDESGQVVTSARPGRRFVELAQTMGKQSYVQSICDPHWAGAVDTIADELLQRHNAILVK